MKWKLPTLRFPSFGPKNKSGYVGMTITDEGLRYAEARATASRIQVRQAGFIELEAGIVRGGKLIDEKKAVEQLEVGMRNTKLKRKKIVLSVPTSLVIIRKVSLPKLPMKEIRPLLEVELESTVHLPFSRPYFDFYKLEEEVKAEPVEEGGEEEWMDQYLVIAAPGDLIDQYTYIFSELKLRLEAVDIEPLALYRVLSSYHFEEEEGCTMYMQANNHTVNVSFFKEGIPEFVRNIPLDLAVHKQKLEEEGMAESFAVELFREVERVINFYQFTMKNDGTRVEKLYVTGEFPYQEPLIPFIRERLVNVEVLSLPVGHIVHPFAEETEVQAYTVPIGLSMKG
ncbi:type IV pilus biogenesis protein PilM [Aneurinibacillus sp. REN35]|uniref:type IV pilus biogenesis protein PilM n=1 Tax=Aneurinibacillus sp. REN35 TaxID=3237286 RepID=UPI0035293E0D